jgi:hypothetical protein
MLGGKEKRSGDSQVGRSKNGERKLRELGPDVVLDLVLGVEADRTDQLRVSYSEGRTATKAR